MLEESSCSMSSSSNISLIEKNETTKYNSCCLWCFHHNSINLPIKYESDNIYCPYFNCCPSCLELRFTKKNKNDAFYLCCCFSIIYE